MKPSVITWMIGFAFLGLVFGTLAASVGDVFASNPAMGAIMLTGYPTVETAREAISLGADEYCVKPIDRSELEEKVEKVLTARGRRQL